jgi:hypothetical protein
MRPPVRILVLLSVLLVLFGPSPALAAGPGDGQANGDVEVEGSAPSDDGAPGDDGSPAADGASDDATGIVLGPNGHPLRCDGGLCDTATGGVVCSIAGPIGSRRVAPPISVALLVGAAGLGTLRRRVRRAKEQAR